MFNNFSILVYSLYRINKNFYPHVLLGGCKHLVKNKTIKRYITEDLTVSEEQSEYDYELKMNVKLKVNVKVKIKIKMKFLYLF